MKPSNVLVVVVALLAGAGCNKPSEESCRQAIQNVQKVLGSEGLTVDIDAQIRRCRGGSSKKAVECAIAAKSREELMACEFFTSDKKSSESK